MEVQSGSFTRGFRGGEAEGGSGNLPVGGGGKTSESSSERLMMGGSRTEGTLANFAAPFCLAGLFLGWRVFDLNVIC